MKIVIMDGHAVNPGDLSWENFQEYGQVEVYERTAKGEIVARAKDADAVFTNKVVFDDGVLEQLPKLKYIGILATGTNVVDIPSAKKRGIVVTFIPAYSTDSVAQVVFAHILNALNRVDKYAVEVRQKRWSNNADFCYWDGQIHEISSLKIGIVGLGHIGMKVAGIAHAFGMKVLAFTSKAATEIPDFIEKVPLEDLLASSDIVTLHCPLTPTTKEMMNKDTLARMKRGAILVNTGRGPLVNEADVAQALSGNHLLAYCADVMCNEPPEGDNPLFSCPNAFITPHLAWGTIEARRRLMGIAQANIEAFLSGKPINVVE